MSRLLDRLLRSNEVWKDTKKSFVRDPPVVISADSVARYTLNNPDHVTSWDEQPIYKCPFDRVFIEATNPDLRNGLPYAWGFGIEWAKDWQRFLNPKVNERDFTIEYQEHPRRIVNHFPYIRFAPIIFTQQTPTSPVVPHCWFVFVLDKDGNPYTEVDWGLCGFWNEELQSEYMYHDYGHDYFAQTYDGRKYLSRLATPLFMALTLINCKNVVMVDEIPTKAAIREERRRNKSGLVSYKTIRVNPMRTVKHYPIDQQEQPDNSKPASLPLHIARGHFKDYRDGKGLFGKMKGIYWWDQHVRGDIENGTVIKDYEVQARA